MVVVVWWCDLVWRERERRVDERRRAPAFHYSIDSIDPIQAVSGTSRQSASGLPSFRCTFAFAFAFAYTSEPHHFF